MAGAPHILILSPGWRTACTVLNVFPLPGLGAILAGARNPHTRLLSHGIAQLLLVVFGSWPLIVPGAIGLAWAIWTATQIHQYARPPPPWSRAVPVAER